MTGNCYHRLKSDYVPLPHFGDNCHLADIVENFFIARSSTAGTVRMDPQFKHKAHREWFIDSVGKLRIGKCTKSLIEHKPETCDGRSEKYQKYRDPKDPNDKKIEEEKNDQLWFYRNYLKCAIRFP